MGRQPMMWENIYIKSGVYLMPSGIVKNFTPCPEVGEMMS